LTEYHKLLKVYSHRKTDTDTTIIHRYLLDDIFELTSLNEILILCHWHRYPSNTSGTTGCFCAFLCMYNIAEELTVTVRTA